MGKELTETRKEIINMLREVERDYRERGVTSEFFIESDIHALLILNGDGLYITVSPFMSRKGQAHVFATKVSRDYLERMKEDDSRVSYPENALPHFPFAIDIKCSSEELERLLEKDVPELRGY